MLEGRKEREVKKRERERKTEENKKTEWRKDAKEVGWLGQDDPSEERRSSSSGRGETLMSLPVAQNEAWEICTHQLETAFADNNEDPERVA